MCDIPKASGVFVCESIMTSVVRKSVRIKYAQSPVGPVSPGLVFIVFSRLLHHTGFQNPKLYDVLPNMNYFGVIKRQTRRHLLSDTP